MYHSIHFIRGVSSLLVLAAHIIFYLDSRILNIGLEWNVGTQGVEIFFVISGFVMIETLNNRKNITARDFIIGRIIRVVPSYWFVSFIKLFIVLILPSLILLDVSWENFVKSLFFLFSRNEEGNIEAFYGVGWTLNYEMFFYSLIFLLLLLKVFSFRLLILVLIICATLSLLDLASLYDAGATFSVLLVNFIWGALISKYKHMYVASSFVNLLLLFLSVTLFFLNIKMTYLGIQYALLVLTLLRFENIFLSCKSKLLNLFGNVSYSLYLVHPMVGVAAVIVLSKLGIESINILFILSYTICFFFAFIFHKFFEIPVTNVLKKRFL